MYDCSKSWHLGCISPPTIFESFENPEILSWNMRVFARYHRFILKYHFPLARLENTIIYIVLINNELRFEDHGVIDKLQWLSTKHESNRMSVGRFLYILTGNMNGNFPSISLYIYLRCFISHSTNDKRSQRGAPPPTSSTL